jgi:hypothetical protein
MYLRCSCRGFIFRKLNTVRFCPYPFQNKSAIWRQGMRQEAADVATVSSQTLHTAGKKRCFSRITGFVEEGIFNLFAARSSKTSVLIYRTTRRYIPEDNKILVTVVGILHFTEPFLVCVSMQPIAMYASVLVSPHRAVNVTLGNTRYRLIQMQTERK